jgi:hypothetical protein
VVFQLLFVSKFFGFFADRTAAKNIFSLLPFRSDTPYLSMRFSDNTSGLAERGEVIIKIELRGK